MQELDTDRPHPWKVVILPHETQDEFDALCERWMAAFEPEDDAALHFVEQIVRNDWFLQRTIRRYNAVEKKLSEIDFSNWTKEQHNEMQLSLRYKGNAEQALNRAIRAGELWTKNRNRDERQNHQDQVRALKEEHAEQLRTQKQKTELAEKERDLRDQHAAIELLIAEAQKKDIDVSKVRAAVKQLKPESPSSKEPPKTAAQMLFPGDNNPKKQKKIHVLEQWVEITVEDGQTVTRLIPTNDELIERGKRMYPAPDLVYRRMNFVHGVPSEYYWTTDDPETRRLGGHGIQRMTVDTWLNVIEKEKNDPSGHIGITPEGNLPRPKERGGCDCPVCTNNQSILDRRAAQKRQHEDPPVDPDMN